MDKAFLVECVEKGNYLVLADSWSDDGPNGVIRFWDYNSLLVEAIAIDKVQQMKLLSEGPVIWRAGVGTIFEERDLSASGRGT